MLAVEQLALDDLAGSRDTDLQFLYSFAKLTATGGSKQNHFLSGKIMAFQEGVDDRGCHIPPNGETKEYNFVFVYRQITVFNLGTKGFVGHFNAAARLLVHPV